jgi:hypothetical protein
MILCSHGVSYHFSTTYFDSEKVYTVLDYYFTKRLRPNQVPLGVLAHNTIIFPLLRQRKKHVRQLWSLFSPVRMFFREYETWLHES